MTTAATVTERYEAALPIGLIDPSKSNPRTNFSQSYIDELSGSIAEKGLIQPIVVREKSGGRFEIVAGECRWRGSKQAKASTVRAIVRDYTDEQVLEIQLIENIHRHDLTPMEQARGYRRLIDSNPDKHSASTIAQRIGMSVDWVWDRLKLNDLIPEVVKLLETDRIAVGHAIVIAKQKPEDQKRIIGIREFSHGGPSMSGLWQDEHGTLDFDEDKPNKKTDPYHGYKPKTVRELERWIDEHIRFDVAHAAKAQPLQFEDVAARVESAERQPGRGKKVISITYEYQLKDDAKDPDERTYGERSWRRADGAEKSKTCDHSVLGLVVAGPSRGQAFDVCIARDRCTVHFGTEIRAREKDAKARASGQTAKADKAIERRQAAEKKREEERKAKEARWKKLHPALTKAAAAALEGQTEELTDTAFAWLVGHLDLPKSTSRAAFMVVLLKHEVTAALKRTGWYYSDHNEAESVALATAVGVDVKAVTAAIDKPEAVSADKKPAKKAAKKAVKR